MFLFNPLCGCRSFCYGLIQTLVAESLNRLLRANSVTCSLSHFPGLQEQSASLALVCALEP